MRTILLVTAAYALVCDKTSKSSFDLDDCNETFGCQLSAGVCAPTASCAQFQADEACEANRWCTFAGICRNVSTCAECRDEFCCEGLDEGILDCDWNSTTDKCHVDHDDPVLVADCSSFNEVSESAEDVEDDCLDYPGCDYVGESSEGKCVPEDGESNTTCSKKTTKAACRAADDCEWEPTTRGVCKNAASCVSLSNEECEDSTWCYLQGGSCEIVNSCTACQTERCCDNFLDGRRECDWSSVTKKCTWKDGGLPDNAVPCQGGKTACGKGDLFGCEMRGTVNSMCKPVKCSVKPRLDCEADDACVWDKMRCRTVGSCVDCGVEDCCTLMIDAANKCDWDIQAQGAKCVRSAIPYNLGQHVAVGILSLVASLLL